MLEIDEFGIGTSERIILECLVNVFNGGPVGLNTLASATGEECSSAGGSAKTAAGREPPLSDCRGRF